jgi:manganese efflux pump family protein
MSVRPTARRRCAIRASAVTGVMLTGLAAGCSHQSAGPQRASVESCIQFGVSAIEHHVTVTSVPAACQGLTRAQVNFAIGSALHVMAIGPGGKVGQRKRVAKFSPFLAHLAASVPEQRSQPPVSAPAAQPAQPASRTTLGLVALVTWLITAGLGTAMTARWIAHGGLRRARAGHAQVPPTMIVAHFGLAVTGLLAWIAYLVTGLTSVAWTASGLLLPVIGLGMAMLILSLPERSLGATAIPASQATPADPAPGPVIDDPPPARHPPTLIVAAHGVFAMATILFAILAAVGLG